MAATSRATRGVRPAQVSRAGDDFGRCRIDPRDASRSARIGDPAGCRRDRNRTFQGYAPCGCSGRAGACPANEALDLVRELKSWPLLDGFRGRPKADVGALIAAIVAFSNMVASLGPRLVEAEINPDLRACRQAGRVGGRRHRRPFILSQSRQATGCQPTGEEQ